MYIDTVYRLIFRFTRPRRMKWFCATLAPIDGAVILDAGGNPHIWQSVDLACTVVLLNRKPATGAAPSSRFLWVVGDGRAMPHRDRSFPIVFSNSVIEHVGDWPAQQAFARELRRVGGKLWVQTPAYVFPIEPHFIMPCAHWLPASWRKRLVRYFSLWGLLDRPSQQAIDRQVDSIRLLTYAEMQELFPECEILVERFLGWPKSYIAVRR